MLNTDGFGLLTKREQFEKCVEAQPFDGAVQVKLIRDAKSAAFIYSNKNLVAKVECPLIRQLGLRIWGAQDYS
jgi:hypothetical protein